MVKFTDDHVRNIRRMAAEGRTSLEIAEACGFKRRSLAAKALSLGIEVARTSLTTLTETEAAEVKTLREAGHGYGSISKITGVTVDRVRRHCGRLNIQKPVTEPTYIVAVKPVFVAPIRSEVARIPSVTQCHYVFGNSWRDYRYCDEPSVDRSSWCEDHRAVCFQRVAA